MSIRPYTSVAAFPTMRRCTCERNCSAPNSTRPRYRPRSEMSRSIFFTYVSGPSAGAYLFSSSTNTTTASTPRSRRSRCSRSFDTTRANTRSWPSGSTFARSTTYTVRSWNSPQGRDRKSTRLNSSHGYISYAVFCLKKKKNTDRLPDGRDLRRRTPRGLVPLLDDRRSAHCRDRDRHDDLRTRIWHDVHDASNHAAG